MSKVVKLSKRAVTVSILVPAILVTLLSSGMAVLQLKTDTAVTADILMSQIDHVTSIARDATRITAEMADRPCETILERMIATGALTPYIRSTGLIRDDIIFCSSVTGSREQSISTVYKGPVSAATGSLKISTIASIRSVPGHTAIIYAFGAGNHIIAFSEVDAQYFTDLMNSLDDENRAVMHLRFSDGPVISSRENTSPSNATFRSDFHSGFSQAHLQVLTPMLSLRHYFLRDMLFLGPQSLLLTLAALYLWRRRQSKNMSLADEIRRGMAEGEFSVYYQPVCETVSGRCIGVEALMRWRRGDGSSISPTVFIRAAEDEGVIINLTQHLFNLVKDDVRSWQVTTPFHLGVNISAAHLADIAFKTDVLRFLGNLETSFILVLEITESSLVEDTVMASDNLNELRQKGCQVAVDDFGTGYCSLSLIQSMPVDYLKIDKSFIDTLTSAGNDTPVLDTIIGLSKRLGLTTIAEGVSTEHQADWLADNRVPYSQGYLYARPMTASDFCQWYKTGRKYP